MPRAITLWGKAADLALVQTAINDSLHKVGKAEKVIGEKEWAERGASASRANIDFS